MNQATQGDVSPMYGYVCFYKGRRAEVYAPSSYDAQQEGARVLRAKKSYDVSVMLAERPDGSDVLHAPVW